LVKVREPNVIVLFKLGGEAVGDDVALGDMVGEVTKVGVGIAEVIGGIAAVGD
jgi:hypothetical protein